MKHIHSLAITQRHPKGLVCKTDHLYAEVADFIYVRIKNELSGFLDQNSIKRASIGCALFLEDYFSNTHQMEVFMQWHKNQFGTSLPIYNNVDGDFFLAKQFQFVLWLSICAERDGHIINPENEALSHMALCVLTEMALSELWERLKPNEELSEYLYCEETQTDIMEIKGVLIWLQRYSFFGYWFDLPEDDLIAEGVEKVLSELNDSQFNYAIDSLSAFGCQTWPCSLSPQEIYARMIRYEMEDENDPLAQDIENIECQKFALYRKLKITSDTILMEDFKGRQFAVLQESFGAMSLCNIDTCSYYVGSFVRFQNQYHSNGIFLWTDIPADVYEKYCVTRQQEEQLFNKEGQYDNFLKKNQGRRIYFFSNFSEYLQWIKKEFKLKNVEDFSLEEVDNRELPLMVFFEPNGQTTIISDIKGIKSPHNPYYDPKQAPQEASQLIVSSIGCSPDCLHYLLQNNLLPDAALNHIKGPKRGQAIMQKNAEFFARCFRRDIRW